MLIEKAMEEMKQFKPLLAEFPKDNKEEVFSNQKFAYFIEGTRTIFKLTLRLYEVLKIIDGQSNYKFKLNNIRTEINNALLEFNMAFEQHIPVID